MLDDFFSSAKKHLGGLWDTAKQFVLDNRK